MSTKYYSLVFDYSWNFRDPETPLERVVQSHCDVFELVENELEKQPEYARSLDKGDIVYRFAKTQSFSASITFLSESHAALMYIYDVLEHYTPEIQDIIEGRYEFGWFLYSFEIKEVDKSVYEKELKFADTFSINLRGFAWGEKRRYDDREDDDDEESCYA